MMKKVPKISYIVISLILAPYLVLFELEVFKALEDIDKHSQIVISTTVAFASWIWLSVHWGFYENITDRTPFKHVLIFISKRTIPSIVFLTVATEGYQLYGMYFSNLDLTLFQAWRLAVNNDSLLTAASLCVLSAVVFYTYGIREPKKSESARWVHMNPNLKHR